MADRVGHDDVDGERILRFAQDDSVAVYCDYRDSRGNIGEG